MYHNTKKKQIILVRHAQAIEATEFDGVDFDRPLSSKGRECALIMTRYLRLIGVKPDCVIASSSIRTRETAEIMCEQYKIANISFLDDLYIGFESKNRDGNQVHLKRIKQTPTDTDILMLVGHNDDITKFARYLCNDEVPTMKKGSLVVLSLPANMNWDSITPGELSILYYLTPQFLKLEELI
ncbi:histidine phosphatase family protein [Candidatus Gracilibacteria bacterium]|nr:histidine phosphatase family protein [Candidatus Gracilibacteria bacterium]